MDRQRVYSRPIVFEPERRDDLNRGRPDEVYAFENTTSVFDILMYMLVKKTILIFTRTYNYSEKISVVKPCVNVISRVYFYISLGRKRV